MHAILGLAILAAVGFGYAAYKHTTLASLKAEVTGLVSRLESYATAEEGKVKAFISAEVTRLRAKL